MKIISMVVMWFMLIGMSVAQAAPLTCTTGAVRGTYIANISALNTKQTLDSGHGNEAVSYMQSAVFTVSIVADGAGNITGTLVQGSVGGQVLADVSATAVTPYVMTDSPCRVDFSLTLPNGAKDSNKDPDNITMQFHGTLRQRNANTYIAPAFVGFVSIPEWDATFPSTFSRDLQARFVE